MPARIGHLLEQLRLVEHLLDEAWPTYQEYDPARREAAAAEFVGRAKAPVDDPKSPREQRLLDLLFARPDTEGRHKGTVRHIVSSRPTTRTAAALSRLGGLPRETPAGQRSPLGERPIGTETGIHSDEPLPSGATELSPIRGKTGELEPIKSDAKRSEIPLTGDPLTARRRELERFREFRSYGRKKKGDKRPETEEERAERERTRMPRHMRRARARMEAFIKRARDDHAARGVQIKNLKNKVAQSRFRANDAHATLAVDHGIVLPHKKKDLDNLVALGLNRNVHKWGLQDLVRYMLHEKHGGVDRKLIRKNVVKGEDPNRSYPINYRDPRTSQEYKIHAYNLSPDEVADRLGGRVSADEVKAIAAGKMPSGFSEDDLPWWNHKKAHDVHRARTGRLRKQLAGANAEYERIGRAIGTAGKAAQSSDPELLTAKIEFLKDAIGRGHAGSRPPSGVPGSRALGSPVTGRKAGKIQRNLERGGVEHGAGVPTAGKVQTTNTGRTQPGTQPGEQYATPYQPPEPRDPSAPPNRPSGRKRKKGAAKEARGQKKAARKAAEDAQKRAEFLASQGKQTEQPKPASKPAQPKTGGRKAPPPPPLAPLPGKAEESMDVYIPRTLIAAGILSEDVLLERRGKFARKAKKDVMADLFPETGGSRNAPPAPPEAPRKKKLSFRELRALGRLRGHKEGTKKVKHKDKHGRESEAEKKKYENQTTFKKCDPGAMVGTPYLRHDNPLNTYVNPDADYPTWPIRPGCRASLAGVGRALQYADPNEAVVRQVIGRVNRLGGIRGKARLHLWGTGVGGQRMETHRGPSGAPKRDKDYGISTGERDDRLHTARAEQHVRGNRRIDPVPLNAAKRSKKKGKAVSKGKTKRSEASRLGTIVTGKKTIGREHEIPRRRDERGILQRGPVSRTPLEAKPPIPMTAKAKAELAEKFKNRAHEGRKQTHRKSSAQKRREKKERQGQ